MKKSMLVILGIVFILIATNVTYVKAQGSGYSREKNTVWEEFLRNHNVTSSLFSKFGIPTLIAGTSLNPTITTYESLEEIGYAFFEENKDLFKMNNPRNELQIKSVSDDTKYGITHIKYQQNYNRIPVQGGVLIVHIRTTDNQILSVNGNYKPSINVSTTPTLSAKQSEKITKEDMELNIGPADVHETDLIIFEKDSNFYLAWALSLISSDYTQPWEYIIDAHSGEIIKKSSSIRTAGVKGGEIIKNQSFILVRNIVISLLLVGLVVFLILKVKKKEKSMKIFRKWWFWVLLVVLIILILFSLYIFYIYTSSLTCVPPDCILG